MTSETNLIPPLVFFTDSKKIDNIKSVIEDLSENTMVIIRDYQINNRHEYALEISRICKQKNLTFLVADDEDLANKLNANGIHLPSYNMNKAASIRGKYPNHILTIATHNENEIKQTIEQKPDAIFLSPIFKTTSHPDQKPLGIKKFQQLCEIYGKDNKIYALGGITKSNINLLEECSISGIAGIELFKNNHSEIVTFIQQHKLKMNHKLAQIEI